jgi:multiple sugar transport system substrate-binding protein
MRRAPDPTLPNPDVAKVLLEQHALQPAFGQTIQGIYTGQLANAKQAVQDLQDRAEAELDRAMKAAQGKGAKVSRDDWKFPNWDPTKDYTAVAYQALAPG